MKNGNYLNQRLQTLNIQDQDNQCQGFQTFTSYHYRILKDEYYNLTNQEKERLYKSPFDNILFTYSDILGERIFYKAKGVKWTKTVERIRYHEQNRWDNWDEESQQFKRSPKYHTAKGGKIAAFFNGIYTYYIKPLQEQGLTQEQIIQKLQPTFQKIVITEGEFKAFKGCQQQIPTIGISGIHNSVNAIKQMKHVNQVQYNFTTDAYFLIELREFFTLFKVREVVFLMDQDAFDNEAHDLRAKSFFAAIRNAYYASRNANLHLRFAYILPNAPGKGLDDLLVAGDAVAIKKELFESELPPTPSWQEGESSPNKKFSNERSRSPNQPSSFGDDSPLPLGEGSGERSSSQVKYIHQIPINNYEALEKLNYAFAQSTQSPPHFFATDKQIIQAPEGTKLSEVIGVGETYNKILEAPTGSGKTFLVATCPDWKIIVCPTISLCENVATEYNAYQFDGKDLPAFEKFMQHFEVWTIVFQFLETISAPLRLSVQSSQHPAKKKNSASLRHSAQSRQHPAKNSQFSILNSQFISVTYKSFRKLTAYLTQHTHRFRVFIDESQNFTTSTNPSYLLKELREVIALSTAYQSTTLLTGTYLPAFHSTIAQLPILKVQIPKPTKTAHLLACNDTLRAAAQLAQQSIKEGRFPMILFNSKNEAGKLGTLKSYLKEQEIAYFNANTKTDSDWQAITKNGKIATNYQGMCVTSVLKEGNNIYNEYDFDIILIGSFHSAEIEQFCNRPRQPKSVRLYKLISDKAQTSDNKRSIYSIATNLLYKAIATAQQLNRKDDQLPIDVLEREFTARQLIAALPIQLDENGRCQIDELRLSNQAFQIDRIQENRNPELLRRRLAQYHIHLSDRQLYEVEKDKEIAAESKEARRLAQQQKEETFDNLYQTLQNKEIYTHASHQLTHHTKQLNDVEKNIYQRIQSVTTLITDKQQVLGMLAEARLSGAKFTLLRRQYIIHCLQADTNYLESQRPFSQLLQDIQAAFPLGERLTAKDIKTKLLIALHKDNSIDTTRIQQDTSNRKAIKVLKLFFDLEKIKGHRERYYTVCGTYWANNLNKIDDYVPQQLPLTKDGYPDFWADIA